MNKLYSNIKKDYKKNFINNLNDININHNNISIETKKYLSNNISIIFDEIDIYINKCKKHLILKSSKYNITFNIYYIRDNELNISKFIKLYNRIIILNNLYNINKTFIIHIILCPIKRFLPKKNNYIDYININGGITDSNINEIIIYRKDENSKVLLHEFIHNIPILNNIFLNINLINKLKNYFNLSYNFNLIINESLVEFWATIYHIIFISIEYNIDYKKLINKELFYSIELYIKLKKLYDYPNKLWYEKSNTFCYVIFKLILLFNYNKFIKNIKYNSYDIVNYIINNHNFDKYEKYYNNQKNYIKSKNSLDIMIFSNF